MTLLDVTGRWEVAGGTLTLSNDGYILPCLQQMRESRGVPAYTGCADTLLSPFFADH